MSTSVNFGRSQLKKPVPRIVTILCDMLHAVSTFTAGYAAFTNHVWVIYGLMVFGIVIERGIKPLFGENEDFREYDQN